MDLNLILIFLRVGWHEWTQQGLLMGFLNKNIFRGKQAILNLKLLRPHNWIRSQDFFEVFEFMLIVWKKISFGGKWAILGLKMAHLYNFHQV